MTKSNNLSHTQDRMLSDLINNIISDPERYGCHLWGHRVSGNILELSVRADYRSEPEAYRMSVIKVGQVLQAIDHEAVSSGHSSQIQSFPSFAESQLVALVRLHKFFGLHTAFDRPNGKNAEISGTLPDLLQSIASHYGLFFHEYNGQAADAFEKYVSGESYKKDNLNGYYSICTTADNPFVWLKTGQWIERVQQLADDASISIHSIESSLSREQRSALKGAFDDCSYVQALIKVS